MFTAKQNTPKSKRSMLSRICVLCILCSTLFLSSCDFLGKKSLTWAPWTDLSGYFNLESVNQENGDLYSFNTYSYTQGKVPYASRHIDDREYNAIVLGTGVWIRSQPHVASYTARCQVQTGDKLTVLNSAGLVNGKYWSYVYINTGYSAGRNGYICTDYIVEQSQYEMLQRYILNSGSGLSLKTESKYLHAIADILIALNANIHRPHLSVSMVDTTPMGAHVIATYSIRNHSLSENNTLLAVVQFFPDNNNYVVLGIVPGNSLSNVRPCGDGSYNVYFYKY